MFRYTYKVYTYMCTRMLCTDGFLTSCSLSHGGPKDHMNSERMVGGIPLVLGLGTRMWDPYVYVVF